MNMKIIRVLLVLVVVGCGSETEKYERLDCHELMFYEVQPETSSEVFKDYVTQALALLCMSKSESDIGYYTYESIATGRVLLDRLSDLNDVDYNSALFFLEGETPATREDGIARILNSWAGYMWANRIYFDLNQSAQEIAATLVHEVNHVLNRSDEYYYFPLDKELSDKEKNDRLNALETAPDMAFREEYRAFYSQAVFQGQSLEHGKSNSMRELKQYVNSVYGFNVDIDSFSDYPPGLFIPDANGWNQRPPSLCGPGLTYFSCE